MAKLSVPKTKLPQMAFNPNFEGNGIIAILIGLLNFLVSLLAQRGIIIVSG